MPTMSRTVKLLKGLLPVILCSFWSGSVYGFGATAHQISGQIAERYICAETRRAIKPFMPEYSLAVAGLWADQIRSDEDWDFARPWHYINVPDDSNIADRQPNASGDLLGAIGRFRRVLADRELPFEERAEAFRFLVHFVVDIHQPLHVGRRSDRGGNAVDVFVNGKKTNLHSYWDSGALNAVVDSPYAYAARLANRDFRLATQWRAAGPEIWATESKAFRPEVYSFGQGSAPGVVELDSAYQARAIEIIDLRLSQAGVRLAGVLDEVFCTAGAGSGP